MINCSFGLIFGPDTLNGQTGNVCHSGLERKWSGGIHPSCKITCVWERLLLGKIPPLAALGRDDMSVGGSVQPHRLYLQRGGRQIAAPTEGYTVQPHGLYLQRFMAMNHRRYIAWYRSTAWVIFGASPERHIGRSLRFRWWVDFLPNVFQKRARPSPNNCQLSTVNCQLSQIVTLIPTRINPYTPVLVSPRVHRFPVAALSAGLGVVLLRCLGTGWS